MFENIPFLVFAYLGIGALLAAGKFWRIAFWYDALYLEEPRGPEVDAMVKCTTLRQFYALPFPGFGTVLLLILGWPVTVIIGAFSGGSLLIMGGGVLIGLCVIAIAYLAFQAMKYAGLLFLMLVFWPFTRSKKPTTPPS